MGRSYFSGAARQWLLLFAAMLTAQVCTATVANPAYYLFPPTFDGMDGPSPAKNILISGTFDDETFGNVRPGSGFKVKFDGVDYDTFCVSANGYITLGTDSMTTGTDTIRTPISGARSNVISAMGMNLTSSTVGGCTERAISWELEPGPFPRRLKFFWQGVTPVGKNACESFEISLREGANPIEFRYQNLGFTDPGNVGAEVGIKGASGDFLNYKTPPAATSWVSAIAGGLSTDTCQTSSTLTTSSAKFEIYTSNKYYVVPSTVHVGPTGTQTTAMIPITAYNTYFNELELTCSITAGTAIAGTDYGFASTTSGHLSRYAPYGFVPVTLFGNSTPGLNKQFTVALTTISGNDPNSFADGVPATITIVNDVPQVATLTERFESASSTVPPTNWTEDFTTGTVHWEFTPSPTCAFSPTIGAPPLEQPYALLNTGSCGGPSGPPIFTALSSGSYDFAGTNMVKIAYDEIYYQPDGANRATLQYSTDGGLNFFSWHEIRQPVSNTVGSSGAGISVHSNLDLSSALAGQTGVKFRFSFESAAQSMPAVWLIDNFAVMTELPAGTANITAADGASVIEGGTLSIPVNLSRVASGPVSFNWALQAGNAVAGLDYTAASGSASIVPPATTMSVGVGSLHNPARTTPRTLSLVLSSITGPAISDPGTPDLLAGSALVLNSESIPANELMGVDMRLGTPSVKLFDMAGVTASTASTSFLNLGGIAAEGYIGADFRGTDRSKMYVVRSLPYNIDAFNSGSVELVTLDTTTMVESVVGPGWVDTNDLHLGFAIDSVADKGYALSADFSGAVTFPFRPIHYLQEINLTAGTASNRQALTLVSPADDNIWLSGLIVRPSDGKLFAIDTGIGPDAFEPSPPPSGIRNGGDRLVTINPATGAVTQIGARFSASFDMASFGSDGAFDAAGTHILWFAQDEASPHTNRLYSIDVATGAIVQLENVEATRGLGQTTAVGAPAPVHAGVRDWRHVGEK